MKICKSVLFLTALAALLFWSALLTIPAQAAPAAGAIAQDGGPQAGLAGVFSPEQLAFLTDLLAKAGWLGLVILLDLVLGVAVALKQKLFKWDKLADFLGDYGPKVIAWLALELLGLLPPDLKAIAGIGQALGMGAYAIILISAAASVLGHAQAIGVLPVKIPGVQPTGK